MLSAEIVHGSRWTALLGMTGVGDCAAIFLFDLPERWSVCGSPSAQFTPKITRMETGGYLGLKLKTVSRILTKLQQRRLLEIHDKDIRTLNMDQLQAVTMDGCIPFPRFRLAPISD